jgi:hypothetical protein
MTQVIMLLLVVLSCVALSGAQDNIENVKNAEKAYKDLGKSSGLDLKYTWTHKSQNTEINKNISNLL